MLISLPATEITAMLRYAALLGLLGSSLALANPPLPPELMQDHQQQQRLQQQQQERAAAAHALDIASKQMTHRCWQAVKEQSKHAGDVLFESTEHVPGDPRLVRGKVYLPDAEGDSQPFSYECLMPGDGRSVQGVKLSELPATPTPANTGATPSPDSPPPDNP